MIAVDKSGNVIIMPTTPTKRAYRYRCYPTDEQAVELSRTFGCVRLVYNLALEARTTAWRQYRRQVSYTDTSALLTEWKRTEDLRFLSEVSSVPLQQGLRHLQTAFTNFFQHGAQYPRFKSRKRGKASAEYTASAFRWRHGQLTLAKMTEPLNIRWSRPLPADARPSTVTVSRDRAGRWHVSILVHTVTPHLPAATAEIGIDLGVTALATLSTGEKIPNPQHEKRERACLARAQRRMARKVKDSRNRAKAARKVARVYAQIADRRRDVLHKLSTRLIRENQVVVVEALSVRTMMKNHRLARAISDASWSKFQSMLRYKGAWYGRTVIFIDRWFPSSKTCSRCGHSLDRLELNVREWTCPACHTVHDRDVNAAVNILAAGRAVAACGDRTRPTRR
ncbi:MAG TPA: RNA-guided endonuclease TnpB family protein [Pseudonocardiaceae bacterium]|nr:RNA-guided endonuclease TnpB family protein [Pseudonocardiaceae bacterium]